MARKKTWWKPRFDRLEDRWVPAGNVTASVVASSLTIIGDNAGNEITIQHGASAGSFVLIGNSGTTVNGKASVQVTGVTRDISVSLLKGSDAVHIGGQNTPLSIRNLFVRTASKTDNQGNDVVDIDHVIVRGRADIRTGAGNDGVSIDDSVFSRAFTDPTVDSLFVALGKGDDVIEIEVDDSMAAVSSFRDRVRIKGGAGNDGFALGIVGDPVNSAVFKDVVILDGGAGIDERADLAGNTFTAAPQLLRIELEVHNEDSAGQVSLTGVSETTFNPLTGTVQFVVSGAQFSTDPSAVLVYVNDTLITGSQLALSAGSISLNYQFVDGRNDVLLLAADSAGLALERGATLWAGNHTLNVTVRDENGAIFSGASVTAALGDDQAVFATGTTSNGQVSFQNLPDRTILITARASGNRFATTAVTGSEGTVQLQLVGFNAPSPIDNNDFHLGTDGWDIGTAPVQIIPHVEEASGAASGSVGAAAEGAPQQPVPRDEPSPTVANSALGRAEDVDLALSTDKEGPVSISRTFTVDPGTTAIRVRWRFITSEYPDYCGTKFNDSFSVSIRSQQGGGEVSQENSMNGLGCDALNSAGATQWFETRLPVSKDGDTVQVDITVANVGDDRRGSVVVVDQVEETKLDITELQLNDIDEKGLQFLSVSDKNNNTYCNSRTCVHGTITIRGDKEDTLESLKLEILRGGTVVATADLSDAAKNQVLVAFGDDEEIRIDKSTKLFELTNAEAVKVGFSQDGQVTLRVKATTADGDEATRDFGAVEILTRYTNGNRFGQRDLNICIGETPPCGGDDWVTPSAKTIFEHFAGVTWNDFSNMNGGNFPGHQAHDDGLHGDGLFAGYYVEDPVTHVKTVTAAAADTIIAHLNDDTYGSNIRVVYVTFTPEFEAAIQGVVLDNGALATTVIQNRTDHHDHFHWILSP